jgi:hypothetical protein
MVAFSSVGLGFTQNTDILEVSENSETWRGMGPLFVGALPESVFVGRG